MRIAEFTLSVSSFFRQTVTGRMPRGIPRVGGAVFDVSRAVKRKTLRPLVFRVLQLFFVLSLSRFCETRCRLRLRGFSRVHEIHRLRLRYFIDCQAKINQLKAMTITIN